MVKTLPENNLDQMIEVMETLAEQAGRNGTEQRNDGTLINTVTQMGTRGDKSEYTTVGSPKLMSQQQVENLYLIPACRRIVTAMPQSAILKGWELDLGENSDIKTIKAFNKAQRRLKIRKVFKDAQIWANIYGGAAIVIIADDGLPPDKPLDRKRLKKIKCLKALDRYKIVPRIDLGIDPSEPEYYDLILPEYVRKSFAEAYKDKQISSYKIHSSRVIRFDGIPLPPDMLRNNNGWGASILENLWDDYKLWKTALKGLGAMIQDVSIFTYKIKDFAEMVASGNKDLLEKRLKLLQLMLSVFGGFAIDSEKEDVGFTTRSFAGADAIAMQLRDAFIGASGLQHDKLFGESPSGLGATGKSEKENWAQDTNSFQVSEWQDKIEYMAELIFLSQEGPTKGDVPEDWGLEFPSILQLSESEQADLRQTQSSVDNTYWNIGSLSEVEIRDSRFGSSKYSTKTILNKEEFRKKQEQQQQQGFGDFGGFGQGEGEDFDFGGISPDQRTDSSDLITWKNIKIQLDSITPNDKEHYMGTIQGKNAIARVLIKSDSNRPTSYIISAVDPNSNIVQQKVLALGFQSPKEIKKTFETEFSSLLFGGITPLSSEDLGQLRNDNCGCLQARLGAGAKRFEEDISSIKSDEEVLAIASSIMPEEIFRLGKWEKTAEGNITGEIFTPIGVYKFAMKGKVFAYKWARELA